MNELVLSRLDLKSTKNNDEKSINLECIEHLGWIWQDQLKKGLTNHLFKRIIYKICPMKRRASDDKLDRCDVIKADLQDLKRILMSLMNMLHLLNMPHLVNMLSLMNMISIMNIK